MGLLADSNPRIFLENFFKKGINDLFIVFPKWEKSKKVCKALLGKMSTLKIITTKKNKKKKAKENQKVAN